jgi:CHAT domain-containing protein
VSSYTPTASILIEKFKALPTATQTRQKLLLVSQAHAPGLSSIPSTAREVGAVMAAMNESGFDAVHLQEGDATIDRVREEMKAHSWIHLACHGNQDITNLLRSAFHLRDGKLGLLLEIIKQHLDNAEFAFLSACQTSTGVNRLSEETVHLAAGMLVVEYRSVVGTLWSIMDSHAPMVAGDFYRYLLDETMDGEQRRKEPGRWANCVCTPLCYPAVPPGFHR